MNRRINYVDEMRRSILWNKEEELRPALIPGGPTPNRQSPINNQPKTKEVEKKTLLKENHVSFHIFFSYY